MKGPPIIKGKKEVWGCEHAHLSLKTQSLVRAGKNSEKTLPGDWERNTSPLLMGFDIDGSAWNLILQGLSDGSRYMELNPTRLV